MRVVWFTEKQVRGCVICHEIEVILSEYDQSPLQLPIRRALMRSRPQQPRSRSSARFHSRIGAKKAPSALTSYDSGTDQIASRPSSSISASPKSHKTQRVVDDSRGRESPAAGPVTSVWPSAPHMIPCADSNPEGPSE